MDGQYFIDREPKRPEDYMQKLLSIIPEDEAKSIQKLVDSCRGCEITIKERADLLDEARRLSNLANLAYHRISQGVINLEMGIVLANAYSLIAIQLNELSKKGVL